MRSATTSARRGLALLTTPTLALALVVALPGPAEAAVGSWGDPTMLVQLPVVAGVDDHAYVVAGGSDTALVVWTDDNAGESRARWWDGTRWGQPAVFPGGLVQRSGIAISDTGDRAVVAWSTGGSGVQVATWLGNAWSAPVSVGDADGEVGVAAMSGDGGTAMVTVLDDGAQTQQAMVWDGQDWTESGVPPVATFDALELSQDGSAATGLSHDGALPSLVRWDGSTWATPTSPADAAGVSSLGVALHLSDSGTQAYVLSLAEDADLAPVGLRVWTVTGGTWGSVDVPTPGDLPALPASVATDDGSSLSLAWAGATGQRVATRTGTSWSTTTVPYSVGTETALSSSANGATLVLTWTGDTDGAVWSTARNGTLWQPRQRLTSADATFHRTSLATSRDGTTSVAAWLGDSCIDECVMAAVRTPVPLARVSGPSVTGTARVGNPLTCQVSYAGAAALSYRWLRDGTPIGGATGARYQLGAADRGHRLACASSATDGTQSLPYATSAATDRVARGPGLAVVKDPRVKGRAAVGATLVAKHGSWSPSAAEYRYQWLRNGNKLKGEKGRRLHVTASLSGRKVAVRVVATRPGYGKGRAVSSPVRVR